MKAILLTSVLTLFLTSHVIAAGSSSVTPAVSKDVKLYNKGVELMLDKKFAKADGMAMPRPQAL